MIEKDPQGRGYYYKKNLRMYDNVLPTAVVKAAFSNLIGSALTGDLHAPVLDIDIPVRLLPSSTPGHSHLYIDYMITWEQYQKLLTALAEVGLLEPGYVSASIAQGQTYVRRPGITKGHDEPEGRESVNLKDLLFGEEEASGDRTGDSVGAVAE